MAVIAKNGSKLVKEVREKKEQNKSRQRFWEMAGSKMGKITGEAHAHDTIPILLILTHISLDSFSSLLTMHFEPCGRARCRLRLSIG